MLAIGWQGGKKSFYAWQNLLFIIAAMRSGDDDEMTTTTVFCVIFFISANCRFCCCCHICCLTIISPQHQPHKKTVFFRQFFTEQNVEMSHSIPSAPYMAANIFRAKIMMNYHSQCVADDIKIYLCNLRWSVKSSSSGSIGVDETTTSISVVKWKLSHSDSFFVYAHGCCCCWRAACTVCSFQCPVLAIILNDKVVNLQTANSLVSIPSFFASLLSPYHSCLMFQSARDAALMSRCCVFHLPYINNEISELCRHWKKELFFCCLHSGVPHHYRIAEFMNSLALGNAIEHTQKNIQTAAALKTKISWIVDVDISSSIDEMDWGGEEKNATEIWYKTDTAQREHWTCFRWNASAASFSLHSASNQDAYLTISLDFLLSLSLSGTIFV